LLPRFIIAAICARKNGGRYHPYSIGLFLALNYNIRVPPCRFEVAQPIAQDYALQTFEKTQLAGAR
jgi:hypothetical protein